MLFSLASLEASLAAGDRDLAWLVHPASWFETVVVAQRCAAVGARVALLLRDADGRVAMAELPVVDFTAAYETMRDWWPELSGAGRPTSLSPTDYEQLVAALRQELMACADRQLAGTAPGTAALGLPDPGHALLASGEPAVRFWRAFIAAHDSAAVHAHALRLASREDAAQLLREHAWLRVLLQRQLSIKWRPELQRALADAYADTSRREELVEAERRLFAPVGLEWLTSGLVDELGLLQSLRRRRPFKLQRVRAGTVQLRDAAAVTVLIPSFRHEAYIKEAIESVLAQSVAELRVLVVDDASPDATVAAARSIDDVRLEVRCNSKNVGLGNSVLAALDSVTTPFVALLNSDDIFHPQRLEKCLAALREDPRCELVSTGLMLVDREGKRLTPRNSSTLFDGRNVHDWVHWYERARPQSARKLDLFGALLERNFLATSSNIVCRTDWLRAHADALRSLKFCLDWQLFLDAAREGKLCWLPEELVAYRLHPSNTVWFEDEARWAYSLEVNRVAARAIRDHLAVLPDDSAERVERALHYIALHLRANTEVDWTGLYLNELIGGYLLEQHSRSSSAIADLVAGLERLAKHGGDAGIASEHLRAELLGTKFTVSRDEVYSLQSRDTWQRGRIDADGERLRQLETSLSEQSGGLARRQLEIQQTTAQLHHLQAEYDRTSVTLGDLREKAAAMSTELEASRAVVEHTKAELEQSRTVLAGVHTDLSDVREKHGELTEQWQRTAAALADTSQRLAQATADLHDTRALVVAVEQERDRLHAELRQETERRQQRERELEHARSAAVAERAIMDRALGRRTAMQRTMASELARQQLEAEHRQQSFLRWRGTAFVPGSSTLWLLRRAAKWRRKFGAAIASLAPTWLSWRMAQPVVVAVANNVEELAELRGLCAEAAAELRTIVVRDGNTPAFAPAVATAPHEVVAWSFPEHQQRDWQHFRKHAPDRCTALLDSLRSTCSGDENRALAAITPHLAFARAVHRHGGALLFANGAIADLGRIAVAARLLGRPWAAFVETLDDGGDALAAWARRQLVNAALVVARSPALRDALVARGVDPAKIVVRPGPISEVVASPADGAPLQLLAMAPLAMGTGWEELVAAAAELNDRGSGLRLDLVGDVVPHDSGSLACAAMLRAMVPAFGLDARLAFGATPASGQRRRHLAAGPVIFVAPWRERSGPSAIDSGVLAAMAAGLPIVGCSVPAIAGAVRHAHEAVLVPPGDVPALAAALAALAMDAAQQQELGARARARYVAEFAPERTRAELGVRVRALLAR